MNISQLIESEEADEFSLRKGVVVFGLDLFNQKDAPVTKPILPDTGRFCIYEKGELMGEWGVRVDENGEISSSDDRFAICLANFL